MGRRKDNGKWTNPGGHANDGEAPIDAGIREAKEETGLDLTQDRLYHLDTRIIHKPSGEKLKIVAYKINLDEGATTIKNDPDDEVHRWVWISLAKPLNKKVFGNLHVPRDNVILDSLGVQMEKKAFFIGFEKRAKWDNTDTALAAGGAGALGGGGYVYYGANKKGTKVKRAISKQRDRLLDAHDLWRDASDKVTHNSPQYLKDSEKRLSARLARRSAIHSGRMDKLQAMADKLSRRKGLAGHVAALGGVALAGLGAKKLWEQTKK